MLVLALVLALVPAAQGADGDSGKSTDWRLAYDSEIDFGANPFSAFNGSVYFIFSAVYDKLLNYDVSTGAPDFKHSLATGYEVSDDGLEYVFRLREGVKWSDGTPFTADDVVWTYTTARDVTNNLEGYVVRMKTIEALDPLTVRVTLKERDARIPSIYVPILPKHIWSKVDPKKLKKFEPCCPLVGTGPFVVTTLKTKGTTILTQNPHFYGPKPEIQRILMTKYEDKEAQFRDIKLNRVDAILNGDAAWVRDAARDPKLEAFGTAQPGFTEIAFNMCPPGGQDACTGPGKDVKVKVIQDRAIRQALQWAIDRDDLVRNVYRNQATAGNGLISPYYKRFYKSFAGDPEVGFTFDPDRARKVLSDGGWTCPAGQLCTKDGETASFKLLVRSTDQEEQNAARRIVAWARDVGIGITTSVVTTDAINAQIYNTSPEDEDKYEPTFDAFLWGWSGDIPTPDFNFEPLQCGSGWTDSFFCNAEYDRISMASVGEIDESKRLQLMHDAERIALVESPYVILVHDGITYVHRNDTWTGYIRQPAPDGDPYANSWVQLTSLKAGEKASTAYAGAPVAIAVLAAAAVGALAFGQLRRRREEQGPLELPEGAAQT